MYKKRTTRINRLRKTSKRKTSKRKTSKIYKLRGAGKMGDKFLAAFGNRKAKYREEIRKADEYAMEIEKAKEPQRQKEAEDREWTERARKMEEEAERNKRGGPMDIFFKKSLLLHGWNQYLQDEVVSFLGRGWHTMDDPAGVTRDEASYYARKLESEGRIEKYKYREGPTLFLKDLKYPSLKDWLDAFGKDYIRD